MKKNTLLFLLFTVVVWQAKGQLSEDFEGSFPPADWTISDNEIGISLWFSSIYRNE